MKINLVRFDLQPGGMNHYNMQLPDGNCCGARASIARWCHRRNSSWINSFSDQNAGITPHPFSKGPWPLEMLTVVTFAENHGKTTVTVEWTPFESSAAERDTFEKEREGMKMGWGGTFDQLEAYLPTTS